MNDQKRETKPENKPEATKLPFFATDAADKPLTARTGIRAGQEQDRKSGGG
jgi:hypothetical protein